MPPSIRNSPCAKLMMLVALYMTLNPTALSP